ncbi:glycosyltransferase family protein [Tenggerimyces flavus]|uniref:Uncharacterized protein n=1 Tax=Tenggerimyces flavus TaxID=1708749 RepID=A0ABV7YI24_9ACTN|nr:hypothetical protein [Tenggerimyces flavus]MBM7789853.1 hypothetical protein [Tenggerimyces flavus]
MADHDLVVTVSRTDALSVGESSLPTYTVLVPLTHGSPGRVLRALAAAQYPRRRLDVKLLSSTADGDVVPMWAEQVRADGPALGALYASGLARARGRYVAVYEPADEPEPEQLRSAVVAFERLGMACAGLWVDGRLHVRRYAAVSVGGWNADTSDHDDLVWRLRRDGFTIAAVQR